MYVNVISLWLNKWLLIDLWTTSQNMYRYISRRVFWNRKVNKKIDGALIYSRTPLYKNTVNFAKRPECSPLEHVHACGVSQCLTLIKTWKQTSQFFPLIFQCLVQSRTLTNDKFLTWRHLCGRMCGQYNDTISKYLIHYFTRIKLLMFCTMYN